MKSFRMRVVIPMLALSLSGVATSAVAQALAPLADYPTRPLTLVSPFPPGGGNDGVSRLLANELSRIIGQSVVVVNRAGAGGNVGVSSVARAAPDGYTLVTSQTSVMAVNPGIYANPGFDPLKDFDAVSQLTSAPLVLVTSKERPYATLADYLADAARRPGKVSYATPGSGTLSHLTGTLIAKHRKLDLMHVPYRGAGPAINDLLGGQVDMLITSPPSVEGMVKEGRLRVLAISNGNGVGVFKGAPGLTSAGTDTLAIDDWYGVFAPKGTPPARVAYLQRAIKQALQTPAVVEKIHSAGANPVGSDPAAFAQAVQRDIAYWKDIVREAKLDVQ